MLRVSGDFLKSPKTPLWLLLQLILPVDLVKNEGDLGVLTTVKRDEVQSVVSLRASERESYSIYYYVTEHCTVRFKIKLNPHARRGVMLDKVYL